MFALITIFEWFSVSMANIIIIMSYKDWEINTLQIDLRFKLSIQILTVSFGHCTKWYDKLMLCINLISTYYYPYQNPYTRPHSQRQYRTQPSSSIYSHYNLLYESWERKLRVRHTHWRDACAAVCVRVGTGAADACADCDMRLL